MMNFSTTNFSRRQVVAGGLGVLATFGLAACGSSSSSTSTAAATTESTPTSPDDLKTFIVGFDQNFPPYGYVGDDGEFTGFDLELAQEVCSRRGWEYQAEPIEWDAKDALINAGTITCIWNGFTMEGREDGYTFSEPYMTNGQVVVTKKDSGITTFEDLAGKNVQVQTDSAGLEALQSDWPDLMASFASLEEIGEYNTIFMNLEAGACDAVVCDISVFALHDAATPDTYVRLDEYLTQEHDAIGFKKGETLLAEAVNETLKEMDEDGFVEELCAKYADQGLTYDTWCL